MRLTDNLFSAAVKKKNPDSNLGNLIVLVTRNSKELIPLLMFVGYILHFAILFPCMPGIPNIEHIVI